MLSTGVLSYMYQPSFKVFHIANTITVAHQRHEYILLYIFCLSDAFGFYEGQTVYHVMVLFINLCQFLVCHSFAVNGNHPASFGM